MNIANLKSLPGAEYFQPSSAGPPHFRPAWPAPRPDGWRPVMKIGMFSFLASIGQARYMIGMLVGDQDGGQGVRIVRPGFHALEGLAA